MSSENEPGHGDLSRPTPTFDQSVLGEFDAALIEERARISERERLARRLHDHVQQLLTAVQMQIGAVRLRVAENEHQSDLQTVEELLRQAIEAARDLTMELSPPALDGGLIPALKWLAEWMKDKHSLHVRLEADGRLELQDRERRGLLVDSLREILFNVVKHAQADQAVLTVRRTDEGEIVAEISDSGIGFDLSADSRVSGLTNSFGLPMIRRRLEMLGGRLEVASAPGWGTTVSLRLPADRS